ncbi:MAG: UDP-3-O-(3-hydroxymyristoyl)glucosamine N-acyltransferase [Pseudomonadota bacterium]
MSTTGFTVSQIADAIGAQAFGDMEIRILRAAEPKDAGADDLALAMQPKYAGGLSAGAARAAILWDGADWEALGLKAAIIPKRARYAMSGLTRMLDPRQGFAPGIDPSAIIDPTADIGTDVSVGPFTVIGAGAKIGPGSVIGPQCFIGQNAVLGEGAYLRDHVTIGARVHIGSRFIANPGARVGGDGFSFVTPEKSDVEKARETLGEGHESTAQAWARIHSLGAVNLGDDVEIGSNSNIDYGTIRDTVVGNGTKIDSLVHVGHNCVIGNDCLLCGLVGLAGSVQVGNNVVLGGQVGVSDNIFIGDGVIAGGGSKILSNVPAGRAVLGFPATKMDQQIQSYKSQRRLPRLIEDVTALKKAVFKPRDSD